MSDRSESVRKWRATTKQRIIEALGGGCAICGYNACHRSLACHHLFDEKKDFSLGSVMACPISWDKTVTELRKCILLCANHHGEIHSGILDVPNGVSRFNELYADYKEVIRNEKKSPCPVCGKMKLMTMITCSRECARKRRYKIEWDKYDLAEMKKTMSLVKIAYALDVSDVAVRKRMKRMGII